MQPALRTPVLTSWLPSSPSRPVPCSGITLCSLISQMFCPILFLKIEAVGRVRVSSTEDLVFIFTYPTWSHMFVFHLLLNGLSARKLVSLYRRFRALCGSSLWSFPVMLWCYSFQHVQSLPTEKITKKPIPDEHLVLKTTFEDLIQRCLSSATDPVRTLRCASLKNPLGNSPVTTAWSVTR